MRNRSKKGFGGRVRELRLAKKISLRKFAKQIGISPTYLSKIEREEFPPPAEEKVKAMAAALSQDLDEFLALAGRMSSDLGRIIQRQPREMATFLRAARGLPAEEIRRLTEEAEERRRSS